MIPMQVLGDRVLVALPPRALEQDPATGFTYQPAGEASGLVLAKPSEAYDLEIATRGIVLQVGEKRGTVDLDEVLAVVEELGYRQAGDDELMLSRQMLRNAFTSLGPTSFDVAVGDCVLFPPSAGEQVEFDGVAYVILHESEIIGIVEPVQEQVAV